MSKFINYLAVILYLVPSSVFSCEPSQVTVKKVDFSFVDRCDNLPRSCYQISGVAVLNNSCSTPVGVQLKLTGYDKDDAPVATVEYWPASIRNLAPGDYVSSAPRQFHYDARIARFELQVIDTRKWDEKH